VPSRIGKLICLSWGPQNQTAGTIRERPLERKKPPSPRWDIYLVRSTPAQLLGTVEAPNADAAIEATVRAFGVNDEHARRLIAILKSRHPRPRENL
jgi:hypothetical protein